MSDEDTDRASDKAIFENPRDNLFCLSGRQLKALACQHGIDGWKDKTPNELVELLAQIDGILDPKPA